MEALHAQYAEHLEQLKTAIQDSELLAAYLEEEGDDEYSALVEMFEPHIHQLHESVTYHSPLQLLALEKALLDDGFEGLYIPKMLGFTVLRGYVGEDVKFSKPQDHFKDIILFACNSPNFEQIQRRIGQAIQIGFALSSDIWIANLLNQIDNKKVRSYLDNQRFYKYQNQTQRVSGLAKFRRQFQSLRFMTATFPKSKHELISEFEVLRHFLKLRYEQGFDNSSIVDALLDFIKNEEFYSTKEFVELFMRIGIYFDLGDGGDQVYKDTFNKLRDVHPNFVSVYFKLLDEHWNSVKMIPLDNEKRMASRVPRDVEDKITKYYNCLDEVYSKGYINEEAIQSVSDFYYSNEGKSLENACLRSAIYSQIATFLTHLPEEAYPDYFELQKTIVRYIDIFGNEQFNLDVKATSLKYVKRLIKRYTDKRGKDYQDIKKFVNAAFVDVGFMTEKKLVELFKTKRKKKTTDA